ncbi:hypothetical protein [Legionella tunisiensis]|uniref:hypothetical protein n=1 Tax=Legionella tunisiensis TaxID=1034944 RepID=UPI0002ECFB5C|nr:hypothetical protein [Legionella tunisiensis]
MTQNNKSLSENNDSLFSKRKGFDTTQQFIEEMKQQYGDYPLSTPVKEINDQSVEKGSNRMESIQKI